MTMYLEIDLRIFGLVITSFIIGLLSTCIFLLWKYDNNIFTYRDVIDVIVTPLISEENTIRYSRQIALKQVGVQGQNILNNTKVLIVGVGGLGSPLALYLSAAGIGVIGIVDSDTVSISNLHRQVIHTCTRKGMNKGYSARESCASINPNCRVLVYPDTLSIELAMELFPLYDIIIDATDNCRSRYLINDAAVYFEKPIVSGAALRWQGHVTVYNYKNGPCYRCIAPRDDNGGIDGTPGGAESFGVLGSVVGVIGCIQSVEVIKLALNMGRSINSESMKVDLDILSGKMFIYDALNTNQMIRIATLKGSDINCKTCGKDSIPFFIKDCNDYKIYQGMDIVNNFYFPFIDNQYILNIEQTRSLLGNKRNKKLNIIDVRPSNIFEMAHLKNSKNIPEEEFVLKLSKYGIQVDSKTAKIIDYEDDNKDALRSYINSILSIEEQGFTNIIICWNGARSYFVTSILQQCFKKLEIHSIYKIYYIAGGIRAIKNEILPNFPDF
ncbi:hypothetical protein cand_007690 [Cryptosporidium andersoni]|uniref:Rhodanese domain-containing protein n=1 Tax=Cryptosporidium andersoni TaxID=117008 RepID=A0A1J4MPP2_9CRYT|nr:hypothetical protein cand_007690 [Cryptosporidium andersoni]